MNLGLAGSASISVLSHLTKLRIPDREVIHVLRGEDRGV